MRPTREWVIVCVILCYIGWWYNEWVNLFVLVYALLFASLSSVWIMASYLSIIWPTCNLHRFIINSTFVQQNTNKQHKAWVFLLMTKQGLTQWEKILPHQLKPCSATVRNCSLKVRSMVRVIYLLNIWFKLPKFEQRSHPELTKDNYYFSFAGHQIDALHAQVYAQVENRPCIE